MRKNGTKKSKKSNIHFNALTGVGPSREESVSRDGSPFSVIEEIFVNFLRTLLESTFYRLLATIYRKVP